MDSKVLGDVFMQFGWPGLIIFAFIVGLFFWFKYLMDKSNKKTSDALATGFTNLSNDMAKHNDKEAYIVFNNYGFALKELYDRLTKDEQYENILLPEAELAPSVIVAEYFVNDPGANT